jgi:serine/threonine protein kinase/2',3'-cyclic-nucleotide 2'-phosphodiesterase (5'-nucleotidase family)
MRRGRGWWLGPVALLNIVAVRTAAAYAPLNMTLLHDALTYGGIFEVDGDTGDCKLNLTATSFTSEPTDKVLGGEATKCAGGGARRHTFFEQARTHLPNVVAVSANHLFFGHSVFFSSGGGEQGAKHIAKHYVGPCKYDAVAIDNSEYFVGAPTFASFVRHLPNSTKVVATFLKVNGNSTKWNLDRESNNTAVGREMDSRIVASAVVNKTGNLVAVMSLSGFDLSRKSNAGDTVTFPFKDPNESEDGSIISKCAPCEEAYLFPAVTKIRQEFRRLQTLHPSLHVLILISKFSRATNVRIAQAAEEVDVIVESEEVNKKTVGHAIEHTTQVTNSVTGKTVLIVNSMVNTNKTLGGENKGSFGRVVGVLRLRFDAMGEMTYHEGQNVIIRKHVFNPSPPEPVQNAWFETTAQTKDQMVSDFKILNNWSSSAQGYVSAELKGDSGKNVGTTPESLFENTGCRTADCDVGRLVAKAMKKACDDQGDGCDVAIVNAGSIRGSLDKGEVTNADIVRVAPFNGMLLRTQMKGKILKKWLEHGISHKIKAGADVEGRFLQCEGLRYAWNPLTNQLLSVLVSKEDKKEDEKSATQKWVPIEDDKEYNVVANEYIGRGGDGFDELENPQVLGLDLQTSIRKFLNTIKNSPSTKQERKGVSPHDIVGNKYFASRFPIKNCSLKGGESSDSKLRLSAPRGCQSIKSEKDRTGFYSIPGDVVIALIFPNSTSQNAREITTTVKAAAAKLSDPESRFDVQIYDTGNTTSDKYLSIVDSLKYEARAKSTPIVILGPMLNHIAYGTGGEESFVKFSTRSYGVPLLTVTFGASGERLGSGTDALFRRVCPKDRDRARAIERAFKVKNWDRVVLVTQKAYSGTELLGHNLVQTIRGLVTTSQEFKLGSSATPSVNKLVEQLVSSKDNIFLLMLEGTHMHQVVDNLKTDHGSVLSAQSGNVWVLPTSGGLFHFPSSSHVLCFGRYEPGAVQTFGPSVASNIRLGGATNLTTDEVLLSAYDAVAFLSKAVKQLIANKVKFSDISEKSIPPIADTVESGVSKFSFDTVGDRIAEFDVLVGGQTGPIRLARWTQAMGLHVLESDRWAGLPITYVDESDVGPASDGNEILIITLIVVVIISAVMFVSFLLRERYVKKIMNAKSSAWRIAADDVELKQLIGKGAFGQVFLGHLGSTQVAIKQFDSSAIKSEEFVAEFAQLVDLRHKHLVQFVGAIIESKCIVTDFMERGDLEGVLNDPGNVFSQMQLGDFCLHIALGLEYLHSKGIAHSDMKTQNVLVDSNFVAKIADFGLSFIADSEKRKKKKASGSFRNTEDVGNNVSNNPGALAGAKGTMSWLPPEVILGGSYDTHGDIFSYGLIVNEIITRSPPFSHVTDMNQFQLSIEVAKNDLRPKWTCKDKLPDMDPVRNIAELCWSKDIQKRPKAKQLCKKLNVALSDIKAKNSPHTSIYQKELALERNGSKSFSIANGSLDEVFKRREKWFVDGDKLTPSYPEVVTSAGYTKGALLDVGNVLLIPLKYRLGKKAKKIKKNIDSAAKEIDELQALSHPNLINFLHATNNGMLDSGYVVFETLGKAYRSLSEYKEKELNSIFRLKEKLALVDDVCEGLSYMHENGVVHGLLSSHCIMVDRNRQVKICRVESRILAHNKAVVDSPADESKGWVAPEVLVLDHYTPSCDIFSIGVLLWYLLVHKQPFQDRSTLDVNRRVVNDSARPPITMKDIEKFRLYDKETGHSYIDLVRHCWAQKIEDRMAMDEVRKVLNAFVTIEKVKENPMYMENPLRQVERLANV